MKRDKIVYGALLCGVVLLCNSCMLGRRQIKSPELELPATVVADATDSLTMADMAWWNVYSDSTLTALIERTLERNKDMLAASARVRRMRALGRVARADQLPSVSGQLAADTEHNDYEGEPASDDPEFDAKVSLAWELDLWGNLRWANRKAVAEYLATVDAQRALQMTLVAEVATAYYELVALDQELSIVRRTLQTRKEGVRQARLRFEGGLTSETALQQAKVELASTATLIPGLESRIALKEHQIALLAGAYPTLRIDRQTMEMHARLPERLKVGLPSELLKRRPDLRQSEQTLRAAEAAMGMASADRFPRITFSLTGGWENDDLKGLFSSPFSYVNGSLVSPLFSFGKKKAKYKAALAACDEARLNYEQKVLEAFREVNDAVVTYRNVRTAAALKRDLQQAAQKYVELAQLQYTLPRIMGKGLALSRLGGGIGTRGPGETKLEVDRRRIRDRIAYIKECIGKVKSVRTLHRAGRAKASVPTVSLVGYTNAGKSTLLNTLTNSDIYAQDQLFATLDPTTRQLDLPNKQQAILTDTVGFIQRLPHQLVAAFQSTLEEVVQSDVLLHVIDVSHELYKEQAAAVYQVLDELGAKDKTIITVYNKIDKLPPDSGLAERLSKEENSICISAKARYNLDGLLALIAENLKLKAVEESFLVPYSDSAAVGRLHDAGTVLEQEYLAEGTLLKVLLDAEQVQQFAKYLAADAKA